MKKNEWITLGVGILVIVIVAYAGGLFASNKAEETANSTNTKSAMDTSSTVPTSSSVPPVEGKNISTDPRIQIIDVKEGTGAVAAAKKTVSVHYTGMLQNGQVFDSSVSRGQPFSFVLGSGQVIKGWDIGVAGMKVGGKRRLIIAPELAYGAQKVGDIIPANSTLIFDVELLGVK